MYIHEYQSKQLLNAYQIPVPYSKVLTKHDDVKDFLNNTDNDSWIIKAQIHAGGRGLAGGIQWAQNRDELETHINNLMGRSLATKQTGPTGLPINVLLIEKPAKFSRELYLSLLVDRTSKCIKAIASSAGGVNIEEVAESDPEKITSVNIYKASGVQGYHCRRLAQNLSLTKIQFKHFSQILSQLYQLFLDKDASLIEINPLVITDDDLLLALDAKINFDDNAMFRQIDISEFYDPSQENPIELKARENDLSYVKLDGNIGCIVNGAGLAMATMDLIMHHGGLPANFLDVGGNTTSERVAEAFKLLIEDKSVKSIFVNIFGGIVRCDVIADGIIQALDKTELSLPVIVLLQGTNAEQAKQLLLNQHDQIFPVASLSEGAQLAINKAFS